MRSIYKFTPILIILCLFISSCSATKTVVSEENISVQQNTSNNTGKIENTGTNINDVISQEIEKSDNTSQTPSNQTPPSQEKSRGQVATTKEKKPEIIVKTESPTTLKQSINTEKQPSTNQNSVDQQTVSTSTYENIASSTDIKRKEDLPAKAYAFTNTSGCCASTKEKFKKFDDQIRTIQSSYGDKIDFVWFDVSSTDIAVQKEMYSVVDLFSIKRAPAFVVVNANNNQLIENIYDLDTDEITNVFERIHN